MTQSETQFQAMQLVATRLTLVTELQDTIEAIANNGPGIDAQHYAEILASVIERHVTQMLIAREAKP